MTCAPLEGPRLNERSVAPRPFLRWIGGKRHLVKRLLRLLPEDVGARVYYEPFLGAGSLFFALQPPNASLSDANVHLVSCYAALRDAPDLIARYLAEHRRHHSKRYYYRIRDLYNANGSPAVQAARFIYLNATCFNGVFRVNTNGAFNVPIGRKTTPYLPLPSEIRAVSKLLKGARLGSASYEFSLASASSNAFAYLDPPYPPLNGTSFFTHYTMDRFRQADQKALADHVRSLHERGARFLMTNADTPAIRKLYEAFEITPLAVTRWVSCKAERYQVSELAITNYSPRGN
jgi:DNA adenine methylase